MNHLPFNDEEIKIPSSTITTALPERPHFAPSDLRINSPQIQLTDRLLFANNLTFLAVLIVAQLTALTNQSLAVSIVILAFLPICVLMLPMRLHNRASKRLLRTLQAMTDEPSVSMQLPIRVKVQYFGVPCVNDVGIATFLDNYLQFDGAFTNFGIRSQDFIVKSLSGNIQLVWTDIHSSIPLRIEFDTLCSQDPKPFLTSWSLWRQSAGQTAPYSIYPQIKRIPDQSTRLLRAYQILAIGINVSLFAHAVRVPTTSSVAAGVVASLIVLAGYATYEYLATRRLAKGVKTRWFLIGTPPSPETLTGGGAQ
jgi:hypothetical protein